MELQENALQLPWRCLILKNNAKRFLDGFLTTFISHKFKQIASLPIIQHTPASLWLVYQFYFQTLLENADIKNTWHGWLPCPL